MALLEVANVLRAFGGVVALNDVSFRVEAGQIKGIIGPNGAGKTTMFNVISGLVAPQQGSIHFEGKSLRGLPPFRIARAGISRTFQTPSLFPNMTVLENVMIGRHCRARCGMLASALRMPWQMVEESRIRTAAMENLEFVGIARFADAPVGSLSFGQRRMVELARALATSPKVLLLDEPASGLNTRESDDLASLIRRMHDRGVTVLLVEHNMSLVMDVCDDLLVLHFGTAIAEGTPETVRNNPKVIEVYLGGEFEDASR